MSFETAEWSVFVIRDSQLTNLPAWSQFNLTMPTALLQFSDSEFSVCQNVAITGS